MMTGDEHYTEGERLLKESWDRDAGVRVGLLLAAQAQAHFTAAVAYASLEERRANRRNEAMRRAVGPYA